MVLLFGAPLAQGRGFEKATAKKKREEDEEQNGNNYHHHDNYSFVFGLLRKTTIVGGGDMHGDTTDNGRWTVLVVHVKVGIL